MNYPYSFLYFKRQLINVVNLFLAVMAMLIGLAWLIWILFSLFKNGLPGISLYLFTEMTQAPGNNGGLLNAVFGSLLMVFFAVLIGAPIGLLIGTYLSEYGKQSKLAKTVRF